MNALTLLTNDHRRVDRLFTEHAKAAGNARRQKALFDDVRRELDVHAQIEEQVFYPALEGQFATPMKEKVEEALAEHEEVKALLKVVVPLAPEDAGYAVAFKKLADGVREHVKEEEAEMFPAAREILGVARLAELGQEMADLKPQLAAGIAEALASAVKAARRVVAVPARRRPAKAVPRLAARGRSRPGTPRR
jgi:iron-sulfur cluster repair protein YtfE (RIC family)